MTSAVLRPAREAGTLARFSRVRSTDPDDFLAGVNSTYGISQVTAAAVPAKEQVYELSAVTGPGFAIGYLRSGLDVRITPRHSHGCYFLNLAPAGAVLSRAGHKALVNSPSLAVVMPPGVPQRLTPSAAGTPSIGIRLDRDLVDAELALLLGTGPDEPLRFGFGLDLTSPAGKGVAGLVRSLLTDADRAGGLFDQPTMRAQYIRTLVQALLVAHEHNYSDSLRRQSAEPRRPRALRLALNYIDEHFAEPLTLADLAGAARCSARTLHDQFQAGTGKSPMAYVQEVRLQTAHRELRDGRPVSDVAYECGFTHLGRFSASYRRRFGVRPSETARFR
ncbi:AraC family transcriptional regulator [Amycolatopsis acidicola]|uniref:AraC family transcriptional regulator n=1 Tax=Amycolatopsis acidicola TaxID=2596893 RepID=A0A5N0V6N8_9PSEU|nr:AraC family transcriptional regulator [Amycolatopsis acidicola]KAA9160730.1 AraC family transcriptional regulator [Amycolatopsis acidicola]